MALEKRPYPNVCHNFPSINGWFRFLTFRCASLPLSELYTVRDPRNPFEPPLFQPPYATHDPHHAGHSHRHGARPRASSSASSSNCSSPTLSARPNLAFPRVVKKRQRVATISGQLEQKVGLEFPGLTPQQRAALLRVVEQEKVSPLLLAKEELGSEGLLSIFTHSSNVEEPKPRYEDFPISEHEIVGDGERLNQIADREEAARAAAKSKEVPELSPAAKYAHFLDFRGRNNLARRQSTALTIPNDPPSGQQHTEMDHEDPLPQQPQSSQHAHPHARETLEEMQMVIYDLKHWAQAALDTPTIFDVETGSIITNPSKAVREAGSDGAYSEFDALLEACKPKSLNFLEATANANGNGASGSDGRLQKIRILRDAYPPENLCKSLANAGFTSSDPANGPGGRRFRRERLRGFGGASWGKQIKENDGGQPDAESGKLVYGSWFVRPEMWNALREKQKADADKYNPSARHASPSRRTGSLVQTKLQEISAHRAKEAALQAAAAAAAAAIVPTSRISTATPTSPPMLLNAAPPSRPSGDQTGPNDRMLVNID
ncbi:uncharacterized protein EV422DRAFT_143377 [Fimicolochytrium jonesii]|uniref:uncharacterized protein n=1 Tax=Fimicolochytrium jonesii TaxID=1396493 RepID=UPI0022FE7A97|nr:uncharacterized protein EV422DRAFT_143377 [Fimicolochytrium jonesii]KAI8825841.1 hypothetical protein EV422DRAFT_143377 [Fimicolochytrium jonesii]